MTMSSRLAAHRAANGDGEAALALTEILSARAEGRQPDVYGARKRTGTLPEQVRAAAPPNPAAPVPGPRATASQSSALTQWDVTMAREAAGKSATARERDRWATVFASEHSVGRERNCVVLLNAQQNWTATAIVKELGSLPTDAQQRQRTPAAQAASDAVWARTNGIVEPAEPTATKPDRNDPGDVWARQFGSNAR